MSIPIPVFFEDEDAFAREERARALLAFVAGLRWPRFGERLDACRREELDQEVCTYIFLRGLDRPPALLQYPLPARVQLQRHSMWVDGLRREHFELRRASPEWSEVIDDGESPVDLLGRAEIVQAILSGSALSPAQRLCIVWHFGLTDGNAMTAREIAVRLGRSVETVKTHMAEGLRRLRAAAEALRGEGE